MKRWGTMLIIASAVVLLACQLDYVFPTATPSSASRATRTPTLNRANPTVAVPTTTALPSAPVIATAKENLRIRNAPSTSSQQIGSLNKGDTAQVVGRNAAGDWWQIALPSSPTARGWIFASFADANGPIDSLPVVPAGGGAPAPIVPPAPRGNPYP
jgi:uncharacterized protein YgiM (DUF1202 family)